MALKPGDVDIRGWALTVERASNLDRMKATKTHERRTVDLTPELVRTLHRHLVWLKEQALRPGWGEPEWLFSERGSWPPERRSRT